MNITIHNLENSLANILRRRAKQDGISLNQTIKRLLAAAVGLRGKKAPRAGDFRRFCGVWGDKEANEFSAALKDFERLNAEDWK